MMSVAGVHVRLLTLFWSNFLLQGWNLQFKFCPSDIGSFPHTFFFQSLFSNWPSFEFVHRNQCCVQICSNINMKWHKCFALTSSVILNFDWFTECLNRTDLVSLPAGISCHNPSSCTAVSCCLEIERFGGRLMEVSLDYSPCGNYLDITIDRIPIKQYLTGFQYGKGRSAMFPLCLIISTPIWWLLIFGQNEDLCRFQQQLWYVPIWFVGTEHTASLKGMFKLK